MLSATRHLVHGFIAAALIASWATPAVQALVCEHAPAQAAHEHHAAPPGASLVASGAATCHGSMVCAAVSVAVIGETPTVPGTPDDAAGTSVVAHHPGANRLPPYTPPPRV